MRIGITGPSGLIGSALAKGLQEGGHRVVPIVRHPPREGEIGWDPDRGQIDEPQIADLDAVVHVGATGVADHRWTTKRKAEIVRSRLTGTTAVASALARATGKPRTLISASAVGFYGIRGDAELTEGSGSGSGFLADLCVRWEDATKVAADAGVRVAILRFGIVLSAAGGALQKQLLPFRLGLGARLGPGQQFLSWTTRSDLVRAVIFILQRGDVAGPFNVTTPQPVTNVQFTAALGRALHRPAKLVVPAATLRLLAGKEMTSEFFLASQRVLPERLRALGFDWEHPSLEIALPFALADTFRPGAPTRV